MLSLHAYLLLTLTWFASRHYSFAAASGNENSDKFDLSDLKQPHELNARCRWSRIMIQTHVEGLMTRTATWSLVVVLSWSLFKAYLAASEPLCRTVLARLQWRINLSISLRMDRFVCPTLV